MNLKFILNIKSCTDHEASALYLQPILSRVTEFFLSLLISSEEIVHILGV